MILKLFVAFELAAVTAFAASKVTSTEEAIVLAGLTLIGLGTIWKALKAGGRVAQRAAHAYSVLLGIDERLAVYDERLKVVEGALDVLRDAHEAGVVELVQRGTGPGRRGTDIVK